MLDSSPSARKPIPRSRRNLVRTSRSTDRSSNSTVGEQASNTRGTGARNPQRDRPRRRRPAAAQGLQPVQGAGQRRSPRRQEHHIVAVRLIQGVIGLPSEPLGSSAGMTTVVFTTKAFALSQRLTATRVSEPCSDVGDR